MQRYFPVFFGLLPLIHTLQFVYHPGSHAMLVQTSRSISAGEEILVNYGPGWFADEGNSKCPCLWCNRDAPSRATSSPATPAVDEGARQEARRGRNHARRYVRRVHNKERRGMQL